jgi:hypothetical protein
MKDLLFAVVLAITSGIRPLHPQPPTTDSRAGVFLFYEAVCFVCFRGKIGAVTQQDLEEGYTDESGLPPRL